MKLRSLITAAIMGMSTLAANAGEPFEFVALGDLPYNDQEVAMLSLPQGAIAKAIQQIAPPFVVHYGDIKPGDMDCSDEVLLARRQLLAKLYPNRLIYTPGDNEWTDCDKSHMQTPLSELERLSKIRQLFFAGQGLDMVRGIDGLKRQPEQPENVSWQAANIQFGTIHLVGTNNGRYSIELNDEKKALSAVDERDKANARWLSQLFNEAEANAAKALVIVMQADPYKPAYEGYESQCSGQNQVKCNGFRFTREFLEFASANAGIPVLLIHGDTSSFCFHRPNSKLAPNFWRLNGPGDYKYIDAVTVSVNVDNKQSPFAIKRILVDEPVPTICEYNKR